MEYCPGGDLFSLLQNIGRCEDELVAKFYTAEVIAALEFLRERNVIHRDLKPDNILISENGHLKLVDFGLSIWGLVDRACSLEETNSVPGTPDYIAPEIILQQYHTYTSDYWSLGCIIYELLTGMAPFHKNTISEIFTQILKCEYSIEELHNNSNEVKDLIQKLLISDPSKRLGASSIDEIKRHQWFSDIDWDNLQNMKPPFVPQLNSEIDTSFFEEKKPPKQNITKDIEKDIKIISKTKSRRRNSFFEDSTEQISSSQHDDDSDIEGFYSVSTDALEFITMKAANEKRTISENNSFSEKTSNTVNSFLCEARSFDSTEIKKKRLRFDRCYKRSSYHHSNNQKDNQNQEKTRFAKSDDL